MIEPLPENYRLKFHKTSGVYTVLEVIGRGASVIVYRARYEAASGRSSERILKEYAPENLKILRTEDGSLQCADSDRKRFVLGKEDFLERGRRQNQLRGEQYLKNETPPLQNIYEANHTLYLEITAFDGTAMNCLSGLSLTISMKLCLAAAKLVQQYHRLGYLCLDLKPENIFVLTNSSGEIVTDLIEFIDFDSIQKKEELSFQHVVKFTPEWAAPELQDTYGGQQIAEPADVYAVGELVFWMVFGRHSRKEEHRGFSKYPFEDPGIPFPKECRRLEIRNLFTQLFRMTLRSAFQNRSDCLAQVIVLMEKLVEELSKKMYVVTRLPDREKWFVGRKTERKQIKELLAKQDVLCIHGLGGVGKSSLVRSYCAEVSGQFDIIVYLQYAVCMQDTLLDERQFRIHGVTRDASESPEEYCQRKMRHFEDLAFEKRVLLVVDNYNQTDAGDLQPVLQKGWIEADVGERLRKSFGVEMSGVDVGAIELDKSSEGYRTLMSVTKDVVAATVRAEAEARVKDIAAKQRIEAENYEEVLRIQREEGQYAKHKQTQSLNMGAFQVEKQAEVGIAGAQALGQMGANGAGDINLGGGSDGFNMAAMMASMAVGGAVGQNIAGSMNNIMQGMNQPVPAGVTPPPILSPVYYVAVNGQATGPFDINILKQMAISGHFKVNDLVWKSGMENWISADSVDELKDLFKNIMPPIPTTEE